MNSVCFCVKCFDIKILFLYFVISWKMKLLFVCLFVFFLIKSFENFNYKFKKFFFYYFILNMCFLILGNKLTRLWWYPVILFSTIKFITEINYFLISCHFDATILNFKLIRQEIFIIKLVNIFIFQYSLEII